MPCPKAQACKKASLQECKDFTPFVSQRLAETLNDAGVSLMTKISDACSLMRMMGLRNPSEPTFASLTAIVAAIAFPGARDSGQGVVDSW